MTTVAVPLEAGAMGPAGQTALPWLPGAWGPALSPLLELHRHVHTGY